MSKPRWIDADVFRALRTATRSRELVVVAGSRHDPAEISSLSALKEALGEDGIEAMADDPRLKAQPSPGMESLMLLGQPGVVTTAVTGFFKASWTAEEDLRTFGPDTKGLRSAFERKQPFVVRLNGALDDPDSLTLTSRSRKVLLKGESRYQTFLREAFRRTVVFSGYDLDDPDLNQLLEDVNHCHKGHVPPNIALVKAGETEPSMALRASVHFGMTLVEYPESMGADEALEELTSILYELEIPKPATGNPPRGFTELTEEFRQSVKVGDDQDLYRFDRGDASGWEWVTAGAAAPRACGDGLRAFLEGEAPEKKVLVGLINGQLGEGKTTLLRNMAWEISSGATRVFWREAGTDLPDRYVPADPDDARALFVCDNAEQLDRLPELLKNLGQSAQGKARLLLAADRSEWERSGLDHRIRPLCELQEVALDEAEPGFGKALGDLWVSRGRVSGDGMTEEILSGLEEGEGCLMDRLAGLRGFAGVGKQVQAAVAMLGSGEAQDVSQRTLLAIGLLHRHGLSMRPSHLAQFLGLAQDQLGGEVLEPLSEIVVKTSGGALRTHHPTVAHGICYAMEVEGDVHDQLVVDLLASMPVDQGEDDGGFCCPSDLIRSVRREPVAPLSLSRFFEAGEAAAEGDVLFWLDRGRCDTEFNRWKEALKAFDTALIKDPGEPWEKLHDAQVHSQRARCLAHMGRKSEAIKAAEEGIRHAPKDAALRGQLKKLGGGRKEKGRRFPRKGGKGASNHSRSKPRARTP
ncbi:MAG: SIR2 family protein [Planctomycetota bacterium]|nr:SIR2 family protein [Planctomycetota bacterium]